MILRTRGIPNQIVEPIVAKITRNPSFREENRILICENEIPKEGLSSFQAILTTQVAENIESNIPIVFEVKTFDHLVDDDIVLVNLNGAINTLYRKNSQQNFILATERCNSNCLMCSQPPKDRDDIPFLFNVYSKLISLIPKECSELGITGGEPTLMGDLFFKLLALMKTELPETEIHCLTNGRAFAWENVAKRLGQMQYPKLMLGIPVYSDYYQMHDYIVQAKGAFNQTIQGLHNLALYDQRIEIRVVLHKQTIPRLTKLARFIYKNLPFVGHVALMGLEYQGYTPHNIDKLWIDPVDYMDELGEAVDYLSNNKMDVSIYNLQLCILPRSLWKFSRKSISDWKNIYLEECTKCSMKEECGGLFASSIYKHSEYIKPFQEVVS